MAKQKLDFSEVKDSFKEMSKDIGSLFKSIGTSGQGNMIAQLGQGISDFGHTTTELGGQLMAVNPIAGAAVIAVGGVVQAFGKIIGIGPKIKELGEQGIAAGRQLSEFSASMSAVIAQKDVADFFRNAALGEQTSESTGQLADAMNALEDVLLPMKAVLQNAFNQVMTVAVDVLTEVVKFLKPLFDLLVEIYNEGLLPILRWITNKDFKRLNPYADSKPMDSGFPAWLEQSAGRRGYIRPQVAI